MLNNLMNCEDNNFDTKSSAILKQVDISGDSISDVKEKRDLPKNRSQKHQQRYNTSFSSLRSHCEE